MRKDTNDHITRKTCLFNQQIYCVYFKKIYRKLIFSIFIQSLRSKRNRFVSRLKVVIYLAVLSLFFVVSFFMNHVLNIGQWLGTLLARKLNQELTFDVFFKIIFSTCMSLSISICLYYVQLLFENRHQKNI